MSNFLENLVARSVGSLPIVEPRVPSIFEPRQPESIGIAFPPAHAPDTAAERKMAASSQAAITGSPPPPSQARAIFPETQTHIPVAGEPTPLRVRPQTPQPTSDVPAIRPDAQPEAQASTPPIVSRRGVIPNHVQDQASAPNPPVNISQIQARKDRTSASTQPQTGSRSVNSNGSILESPPQSILRRVGPQGPAPLAKTSAQEPDPRRTAAPAQDSLPVRSLRRIVPGDPPLVAVPAQRAAPEGPQPASTAVEAGRPAAQPAPRPAPLMPATQPESRLHEISAEAQHPPYASNETAPRTSLQSRPPANPPAHAPTVLPAPASPPAINVTIGRIEVRASFPEALSRPATPRPSRPTLSLDEYLKGRSQGTR